MLSSITSQSPMSSAAERQLEAAIEILPGRLYWVPLGGAPPQQAHKNFFCIDNDLIYWNFFLDFGPLNLGHLYRYCALLNSKLSEPKLKDKVIYHYCGNHPHKVRRVCSCAMHVSCSACSINCLVHIHLGGLLTPMHLPLPLASSSSPGAAASQFGLPNRRLDYAVSVSVARRCLPTLPKCAPVLPAMARCHSRHVLLQLDGAGHAARPAQSV